jgi:hypothetical protein
MQENDESPQTAHAHVRFGLRADNDPLTPERRAIERIKRKASAMATAAAAECSAWGAPDAPEDLACDALQPPLARQCRCADVDVKAYREEGEWICQSCGHEVPARASRGLTVRARTRDRDHPSRAWDATQVQPPVT